MRNNLALIGQLQQLAAGHGITAAQLALAWLLQRDEQVVPIPGARQLGHLEENAAAAAVTLGAADLAAIDVIFRAGSVQGERYTQGDFDLVEK